MFALVMKRLLRRQLVNAITGEDLNCDEQKDEGNTEEANWPAEEDC